MRIQRNFIYLSTFFGIISLFSLHGAVPSNEKRKSFSSSIGSSSETQAKWPDFYTNDDEKQGYDDEWVTCEHFTASSKAGVEFNNLQKSFSHESFVAIEEENLSFSDGAISGPQTQVTTPRRNWPISPVAQPTTEPEKTLPLMQSLEAIEQCDFSFPKKPSGSEKKKSRKKEKSTFFSSIKKIYKGFIAPSNKQKEDKAIFDDNDVEDIPDTNVKIDPRTLQQSFQKVPFAFKKTHKNFLNCVEQENVDQAYKALKELKQHQTTVEKEGQLAADHYIEKTKKALIDHFDNQYQLIHQIIQMPHTQLCEDVIYQLREALSFFMAHVYMVREVYPKNTLNGDIPPKSPPNFDIKVENTAKILYEFMQGWYNQYVEACTQKDISKLQEALKMIKLLDEHRFYKNKKPYLSSVLSMNKVLSIKDYKALQKSLTEELNKIYNSIKEEGLFNNPQRLKKKLTKDLPFLEKASLLETDAKSNRINSIRAIFSKAIKIKVTDLLAIARQQSWKKDYYNELNKCRASIKVLQEYPTLIRKVVLEGYLSQLRQAIKKNVELIANQAKQEENLRSIIQSLVQLKDMESNMEDFSMMINSYIEDVLSEQKRTTLVKLGQGIKKFDKFFVGDEFLTKEEKKSLFNRIIRRHGTFFSYTKNALFAERVASSSVEDVLNRLTQEGAPINKQELKSAYIKYKALYDELIKKYLKPNAKLDKIVKEIYKKDLKKKNLVRLFKSNDCDIPLLTARVFALWTLLQAQTYFKAQSGQNHAAKIQYDYLMHAYPSQIITIFRLLGVDNKSKLENHLAQVFTGQGKSLILGGLAAILAILGFEVHCACFSEYLSNRDHKLFNELFKKLGLLGNSAISKEPVIYYGNIDTFFEEEMLRQGGLYEQIEALMKDLPPPSTSSYTRDREVVLLIDEVDIFFVQCFGCVYQFLQGLQDPTITELIHYLWEEKDNNLTLEKVKQSEAYQACCAAFPKWTAFVEAETKKLIKELNKDSISHEYCVYQGQIGYKDGDKICVNLQHGYETMWAYFHEYNKENSQIDPDRLKESTAFQVSYGSYSLTAYLQQYSLLLGVTGTLKELSPIIKGEIACSYKIKRYTYVPSIYKTQQIPNKLPITLFDTEEDYFKGIREEIENKRTRDGIGQLLKKSINRCVIVFFKTKVLERFLESKDQPNYGANNLQVLTVDLSDDEKKRIIENATLPDKVTFCDESFIRGTDFRCYESYINEQCGGVPIISTFLPKNKSQETQFRGRTRRQGMPGEDSIILCKKDLEKEFDISPKQLDKALKKTSLHTLIYVRDEFFEKYLKKLQEEREFLLTEDKKSVAFREDLKKRDVQKVLKFLLSFD
ncbi:MAG: hypothetical protein AAF335_02450 [Bacteroidota bacterium]